MDLAGRHSQGANLYAGFWAAKIIGFVQRVLEPFLGTKVISRNEILLLSRSAVREDKDRDTEQPWLELGTEMYRDQSW